MILKYILIISSWNIVVEIDYVYRKHINLHIMRKTNQSIYIACVTGLEVAMDNCFRDNSINIFIWICISFNKCIVIIFLMNWWIFVTSDSVKQLNSYLLHRLVRAVCKKPSLALHTDPWNTAVTHRDNNNMNIVYQRRSLLRRRSVEFDLFDMAVLLSRSQLFVGWVTCFHMHICLVPLKTFFLICAHKENKWFNLPL